MSKELDDALTYIDDKFLIMSMRLNHLHETLARFEERINKLEGTESVLYDEEHPADTMMFRKQEEEDEEP